MSEYDVIVIGGGIAVIACGYHHHDPGRPSLLHGLSQRIDLVRLPRQR